MAMTFILDDDGNVTWDRSYKGELSQQEATVAAAIMTANRLGYIGDCIKRLAEAMEEMQLESASGSERARKRPGAAPN